MAYITEVKEVVSAGKAAEVFEQWVILSEVVVEAHCPVWVKLGHTHEVFFDSGIILLALMVGCSRVAIKGEGDNMLV